MTKKFLRTKGFAGIVTLIITLCMVTCVFAACGGNNSAITLSETSVTLYEGDSKTLTATTKKEGAAVEWNSSNTGVVTVRRGVLDAIAAGTAVITASLESGESATCTVEVGVRTMSISHTEVTIDLGSANKTFTLTAEASDKGTVSWTSSNPSVASVSGGVVTALDVGVATITAQKGRAQATCVVTVTDDSRPADYYWLAMNNNADSRANPGKWHYWADGTSGTAYKFSEAPLHANSSLSVTLSIIPNLTVQFFYFRYQPKYTTSRDFTMKFDIEFSLDGIVRYGTSGAFLNQALTKNESFHAEYSGTINDTEPFSIRPNAITNPDNEPLTIKITNIAVETDWDGLDEPDPGEDEEEVPVDIVMGDYLQMKANSEVVASPGNWYYMADGAPGTNYEFSVAPNYNSALNIVSMGLSYSTAGNVYQLRYQPDYEVGTEYTVKFDVQLTAAGSIVYSPGNKVQSFPKAGTESLSWSGAVGTSPFYIQLRPSKPEKSIKMIVSNIIFTIGSGEEDPDPDPDPDDAYSLTMTNNAETRADAGVWHYWVDGATGTDYQFSAAPAHENSALSVTLSKTPNLTSHYFYFRYQPKYTAVKAYKISFDIEFSLDGIVRFGTASAYGGYDNTTLTKNESQSIVYNGEVNDTEPFSIRPNAITNPNNEPLTIKVTNIVIETDYDGGSDPGEDEDEVPVDIVMGDNLQMKMNSEVVASPGNWYYMADGAPGTNYEFSVAPNYNSALNIVSVGLSYSAAGAVYQLRYQPDYAAGTNYTVTFDVQLTAAGSIVYSPANKAESFPKAGTASLSWTGAVGSSPFYVQLRPSKPEKSIKMIISNIVFTPESVGDVEDVSYGLTLSNNAGVVANPGTWYYTAEGSDGTAFKFSTAPNYNKGTLTMGFEWHASGTPAYQLRYQPDFAVGTTYTVTFDVNVSAAGKVIYSINNLAKDFTAGETASMSWTGAVSGTNPFFIQIRATDPASPITITVTNIVFTPAA